jgi:hypothetical protein
MVAALAAVVGPIGFGAIRLRRRLVPGWAGGPARLAEAVLGLGALVVVMQILGIAGVLTLPAILCASVALGAAMALVGARAARADRDSGPRRMRAGTIGALAVATWLVLLWAGPALVSLHQGIVDGDSLWYHMPFAARFAQDSSITALQFDGPYYLSWFYPANSELIHAFGLLVARNRDVISPLISFIWLALAVLAAWCIARPFGVGPAGVATVALVLGSALIVHREPGAARSDMAALAFMLASAAVLVNGWDGSRLDQGSLPIAGLAAGLAVGSKLTAVPAVAVIFMGVIALARGERLRAAAVWIACALLTGGFWYVRNLLDAGNPLPWIRLGVGPVTLASPDPDPSAQYRFSVLHYVLNARVWRDYFLPGLHEELGPLWPLLLALAAAGVALAMARGSPIQRTLGAAAIVSAIAYVVNPMSAPGPDGAPTQFATNLRYLVPALVLGLVLLPTFLPRPLRSIRWLLPPLAAVLLITGAQPDLGRLDRHGMGSLLARSHMDAAYRWAQGVRGARIATSSVLMYGLTGDALSNQVRYLGVPGPRGTFSDATTCPEWREALDAGDFNFLVLAPQYEGSTPAVPRTWVRSPNARPVLRSGPTTVFRLSGSIDPNQCG